MKKPIVLGLTGGIGMGKTTASKMLKSLGIPIFNADKCNHDILNGVAFNKIKELFPECIVNGKINRVILGNMVTGKDCINKLENITFPLIRKELENFIESQNTKYVLLDIPTLFENGFDVYCDYVISLECPDFIQEKRVLARNNFNIPKFQYIKNRQMTKKDRREKSDFTVYSVQKKKMFKSLIEVIKCVK